MPVTRRSPSFTRRRLLRTGAGAALALSPVGRAAVALGRTPKPLRRPGSLPDPSRPAGEPTGALPFDHIVVLMMENHSFDCYFGMLPRRGQRLADGFSFDSHGMPRNGNPLDDQTVLVTPAQTECQASVTQSWNATHLQIDGGRMDGFAATAPQ